MKKTLLYFIFFIACSCKTAGCVDTNACDYFLVTYKRLEDYTNKKSGSTIRSEDVDFMTRLTGITPSYFEGIDILYRPSEQDLLGWKKWYNENKAKLYWDEDEKTVKIKQ